MTVAIGVTFLGTGTPGETLPRGVGCSSKFTILKVRHRCPAGKPSERVAFGVVLQR